jgi:hypothetical protein
MSFPSQILFFTISAVLWQGATHPPDLRKYYFLRKFLGMPSRPFNLGQGALFGLVLHTLRVYVVMWPLRILIEVFFFFYSIYLACTMFLG